MDTGLNDVPQDSKTANCVKCSRSMEHSVCLVLHLLDSGWVVEQTPRKNNDGEQAREIVMTA